MARSLGKGRRPPPRQTEAQRLAQAKAAGASVAGAQKGAKAADAQSKRDARSAAKEERAREADKFRGTEIQAGEGEKVAGPIAKAFAHGASISGIGTSAIGRARKKLDTDE